MAIQAKVVASQVEVATATQQTVQGSIVLQQASNVALDVTADAVASYQQVGADLVVHLKDGETIRIANFYAPDQPPSQLYLVNEKGDLVVTELDQVAADGTLTATYASEPIDAGFESLTGSEAAAAGSAGAAGGIAGLGVTGTILAAAAVIAGGAAIASGGGGGGGGGSGSNPPATPAPATDVAVSPDGSTISGRAAPGSTVEVDVNGDGQPDYSAPVDGNGNFQVPVSPPLSNGETVTVIVRGPNGGSGSSGTTVTAPDTTAPGAATGVTVSEDGSKVSGSAEPGATVKVDTNGDGIPDASGVAGSDGTFQITLPTPVNNGQSVTVTVTDHAGNTGPATVVSAPDTTPPAPASGLAISADGSQLTGHAEPGSSLTIDLNNDGVPDITVQVGADGGFSLTLNPPLLGGQPVSVIVHDAAGNASPLVQVIAPNPSSLPSPVMEASNGHVIQGTATFGTTVYLTNAQGGVIGVALVGGDGHWSFTPTVPLPDGTVINAIARGPMGTSGTSSVTVDSVAPTAPTIAPSNGSLLEGTAEAGSTVVLTGPGGVPIGTVRADGNGHWSFTPGSALSNGTEVTATACDAAGNTSLPGHVTVDALAPAAPLVNPSDGGLFSGTAEPGATILLLNGNGQQIGQTQADGSGAWSFTFSPPLANGSEVKVLAKDASGNVGAPSTVVVDDGTVPAPVVEPSDGHMIFGHAEPGLRVEIRDANGTLLAAVTADGNGSWSYTPGAQLPNGTQLQVTAVDTTNNHQSTVVLVTTDSVAPAAPHVDASNGSVIAGTGEIGATIILLDGNGNPIGQTTVDANGHWTFSPQTPLANGTLVNAIARDAAGNSSLAGTVTVDTIAPPPPVVAPSNGLVLTGTAEAGATVRILDAGGNLIGQTSADGSGNWSFTPPAQIPNGSVLSVVAVDPSGNPSLASSVTVDGLAPSVPVIAPSNGSVLSGTAEANARVILTDGSGNPIGQVTADGSGHWSFTPGVPLANGTVVNAVARDAAGNTSTSAQATVDAVAPPAPQVNPSNGLQLSGTAEPGSTVLISDGNGNPLGQVTVGVNGAWSFTFGQQQPDGTLLQVTARDAAGNTSIAASTTVNSALVSPPQVDASNGVDFSGTAEAGQQIVIRDGNGNLIGQTSADGNGHWSFSAGSALANGAAYQVVAVDPGSGRSSVPVSGTVDSVAPAAPTIDGSNGTSLSGSAEAGSTVTLRDGSGNLIGQVSADGTGHWSFTPASPLPNGTVVNAVASDAAGNASTPASTTVDNVAPPTPTVDPSNGALVEGSAEPGATIVVRDAGGNVIGQVTADGGGHWSFAPQPALANGTQLTVQARDAAGNESGTASVTVDTQAPAAPVVEPSSGSELSGTAEANAEVVIISANGQVIAQVPVSPGGTWSYTPSSPLPDGATLSVVAVDSAGNRSGTTTITVDSTPPAAPVVNPSNGASISGTAEPGSTVTVTDGSNNPVGQTTADGQGNWSITPTTSLPNGSTVTVVATDAAGNPSIGTSTVVDSSAPSTPVVNPSNGTSLSGTGEEGSTLVFTDGSGNALGQTTVGAGGAWSFTPHQPLADGTVVAVVAKDASGNQSGTVQVTVDAVPPANPTLDPSNGVSLTGTGEIGSTVIISVAGSEVARVIVGNDGHWSYTPGSQLANNTNVSVVAVDAAGNSSQTVSGVIDSVAPPIPTILPSEGLTFSGTAEAGATVILTDAGGNPIGQTTADADGRWTFNAGTQVPDGTVVNAVARDAAGNSSGAASTTVDADAPAAPLINPSNGTSVSGTAEIGSTITLVYANNVLIGQATTDSSGKWTFSLSPPLPDGTVITVVAQDAAGNTSNAASIVIDSISPPTPTVLPSNGSSLSGTAEAGSTVIVSLGGVELGRVQADINGHWTLPLSPTLGDGTHPSVVAVDAAGNASAPTTVTIDAVAPGAPTISDSNGTLLIGTAEAGSTVILTNGSGTAIGQTTADSSGHWSFTPPVPLPNGTSVTAVAQDAAGNTGPSASVVVDTALPNPPVIEPSNGATISGTADALALVRILDAGGNVLIEVNADGSGHWSWTPSAPLANGVEVRAVVVDGTRVSGVSSVIIDALPPAQPVVQPSNGILLSGSAEAGSVITLLDGGGQLIGSTTADAAGKWSFSPGSPLADGTQVQVLATDAAGNTSIPGLTTIDAVAPAAPVVAPSNGSVLAGTAEANATILLTDGNGNVIGQTTADGSGNWSFTPIAALANGTVVNAVARDAAGNTSVLGSTTIDSVAPGVPTVDPSNGVVLSGTAEANATILITDGNGNPIGQTVANGSGQWSFTPGTPLANGVVVDVVARDAAGNTSGVASTTVDAVSPPNPTIDLSNGTLLSGTAEANATVILTDGNGNPIGQVRADGAGNWSLTVSPALANGTLVNAVARDAAGNTSGPVSTTIDSVAPANPTIAASNGNELHGTAEINATVILTDGNGNLIGQTTANGSGVWSFTPGTALANGTVVNAVARDAVGNTSGAASTTIDSVAPATPTIDPSNGSLLSGTAEANATVILTDGNGNPIGQTTANGSGNWSFTPGVALPDGAVVNVVARDAAGNSSGVATTTVDTLPPPTPTVEPSNGTHLAGTAEAGARVILTDGGGNPIGQTTADGSGHWSFTPGTALANGTVVNVQARDAAGNGSGIATTTVDSVAPPTPTIDPSNGTQLAGTAESSATVILHDGNGNLIGTTQADGSGHWSFTPSPALANGTTVNAVAQDAAGNTSGAASTVVDNQAPNPPVCDPSNGTLLSGTGEVGATILISVGGVTLAQVQVDGSGHWNYAPPIGLQDGVQVSVVARDAAGNLSSAVNVTVDAVAPPPPVIAASDGTVFAGTAEANATVVLSIGGSVLAEVKVDANGNWQYVPAVPVGDGVLVSASARDAAGNVGLPGDVTVDASLPAIPVINPSNGLSISGTAEANATVLISVNGVQVAQVTVNGDGSWSYVPGVPLADGAVVSAIARDASSNLSGTATAVVDALAPAVPVVTPSNGSVLSGTAEAGATVILSVGGIPIAQVTADASGHWSYAPGTALANGVQVSVVARDAAGNTSGAASVTVDSVAPNAPTIAASNGVTFSGTAEANSTVVITGANGALLGQVTTNASGIWSFTPGVPLGNGVVVSVVAKDAAGNVSVAASTTVDAVAPSVPVVTPSNGTVFSGTAEAGSTVILSVGGAVIGQVTANAQGQWSFAPGTAVANNAQVSIVAKDAVGNTSVAASVTVDAVAPTAPVVAPSNGTLLSGTAEIGSTVILKVGGAVIAQVTADGTGHWSFTPGTALANNTQVSVTTKDAAGNVSVATTVSIDSVAPVAPSGLSVSANGTVLTGIAEANSTVKVIINGDTNNPITVQANGSGNFTVNLSPALTAGQVLTVNAVDAAGNTGAAIQIQAPDLTRPVLSVAEAADGYINKTELSDGIQVRVGLTAGAQVGQTLTLRYSGAGGFTYTQAHVLTAAEILAGVALVTLLPAAGVGVIPQGTATLTADVNGGLTATPASFTVDTLAPSAPVLSLAGNVLGIGGEVNSTLLVDVNVAGLSSHTELSAGSTGIGSLDLLSGLTGVSLTWDQLLDASVSVASRDAAGNVGNVASINLENVLTQNTVTIGGLGLAVGLLPPTLGISGAAIAGGSLTVQVITPALNVTLHPTVDATGHFTINLLAPDLLAQLGLSVTQILNLGSQLSLQLIAYDASGHQSATYGISLTGSGLTLAIGEVSVTGTAGADVFLGQNGAEHFYGNAGADLFLHVGTGDIVQAGDGNDTIQLQATNFKSIDGGNGFDTVMLDHGISLNYGAVGTGTWTNIERVDMGKGDAGGSLTLTAAQVDAVTDGNNVLQVTGDSNDTLTVRGAVDTGVNQVHSGISYDVYTFGNTTLLVEENTVHVVVS